MNGHPISARQPPGILFALIASCLIHGAVIFLPYLGASSREAHPTARKLQQQPSAIAATLTTPRKTPFALPKPTESPTPPVETPRQAAPSEPQPIVQQREGLDVLPIDAPLFYPTNQLTEPPQVLEITQLETPEIKPIVASGKMVMKLWINDIGEVVNAEIEKSDLPEVFDRSAIAVFKRMRFAPGERHGKPVGSVMRIEVTYDDGRRPPEPSEPPQQPSSNQP